MTANHATEKVCEAADQSVCDMAIPRQYPDELTPNLRDVLGWPNFKCAPIAHVMRAAGSDIKLRSEDEQAAVLDWLVKLDFTYGERWWEAGSEELRTMQEAIRRKRGVGVIGNFRRVRIRDVARKGFLPSAQTAHGLC